MEFKAGDRVVHPAHGVGDIVRLEERRLAEDEARLYYVIVADKSTVWVPVDTHRTAGLRQLTPKRDLGRYRGLLKSDPVSLQKDHNKRRLEIADRLKQGSFQAMCEVVRDLTAHGRRKPLNDADMALLQKIRIDLCREWAAADGISIEEAIKEVESLLLEARPAYVA
ncbi:MAG: CarD family transcriptional regulator [Anaerolineae bacterium]